MSTANRVGKVMARQFVADYRVGDALSPNPMNLESAGLMSDESAYVITDQFAYHVSGGKCDTFFGGHAMPVGTVRLTSDSESVLRTLRMHLRLDPDLALDKRGELLAKPEEVSAAEAEPAHPPLMDPWGNRLPDALQGPWIEPTRLLLSYLTSNLERMREVYGWLARLKAFENIVENDQPYALAVVLFSSDPSTRDTFKPYRGVLEQNWDKLLEKALVLVEAARESSALDLPSAEKVYPTSDNIQDALVEWMVKVAQWKGDAEGDEWLRSRGGRIERGIMKLRGKGLSVLRRLSEIAIDPRMRSAALDFVQRIERE